LWSSEPTYTIPPATTGEDDTGPPVGAVHNGAHVFGLPEQFVVPAASNAYNLLSPEPMYTIPPTTAGDEFADPPVAAVHNGAQAFGLPEQFVVPAASNA
jgi:hypothetical protein